MLEGLVEVLQRRSNPIFWVALTVLVGLAAVLWRSL